MKSNSRVKLLRYLAYILIFISVESHAITLAHFLKPSNRSEQPNEPSSSQISPKANAAKKAAAKKAAAKKAAAKKAAAKKAAAKKAAAKKAAAKKAAAKKAAAKKAAAKKAATKKSNSNKTTAMKNNNTSPPSSVNIDPLRDLGINKGYVCFRIKAYSTRKVSDFSKAVCTYIKNSKKIKLAWIPSSKSVIGYQVYFGTSAKKTENFISDVM